MRVFKAFPVLSHRVVDLCCHTASYGQFQAVLPLLAQMYGFQDVRFPLRRLAGGKAYSCKGVERGGYAADVFLLPGYLKCPFGIFHSLGIVRASEMEYGEYVGAVRLQQRVRMEFAQVHRLERVLHRAVIVLAVEIPFSGPIPGQGLQGPAFSR